MSMAWASERPGIVPGPPDPSGRQWGVVCLLQATSSPAQGARYRTPPQHVVMRVRQHDLMCLEDPCVTSTVD